MHLTLSADFGCCAYFTIGHSGTALHTLTIIIHIVAILAPSALGLVVQVADVTFPAVVLNFCTVRGAACHLA